MCYGFIVLRALPIHLTGKRFDVMDLFFFIFGGGGSNSSGDGCLFWILFHSKRFVIFIFGTRRGFGFNFGIGIWCSLKM